MNLLLLPLIFFSLAADYGSIGLYAHDYEPFYAIEEGDHLYYYDEYTVVSVWEFEALQPQSIYSDFAGYGLHLDVEEMFMMTYGRPGTLVLQTCKGNNRVFIVAAQTARTGL